MIFNNKTLNYKMKFNYYKNNKILNRYNQILNNRLK